MELTWRRENIVFKVFICPTQRQHLQDTTKSSKPLKNEKIRRKKRCVFFILCCFLCGNKFLIDLKHNNETI